MRLLVTGGTGFIGSHFIQRAIGEGNDVICLRRSGSIPKISLTKQPKWIDGEYEDDFQDSFRNADLLVHIASHSTNYPYDTLENCLLHNVTRPLAFLQNAKINGIQNFIIIGSGFEYGLSGENFKFIPTDAPLLPQVTYSVSKAVGSLVFAQWALQNKLKLKYLRLFHVFGEGEDESRLWPSLKRAASNGDDFKLTSGEQIRDFTNVSEIAKKILSEVKEFNVNAGETQIKNIGSNNPQSVKDFSEYWWDHWKAVGKLHFGAKPYRDDEVMRFVPDLTNSK